MKAPARAIPALALLLAAAGCSHDRARVRATLDAGSSAKVISWTLATSDGRPAVSLIRVANTGVTYRTSIEGGRSMWTVAPIGSGSRPLPPKLRYGVPPPGFTSTSALGLGPGHYMLEIVSDGVSSISYFRVDDDGSVW